MNPNPDFAAMLEQALATRSNRTASSAELRAAAEQARSVVVAIDAENERSPQREAEILAAMVSKSISETLTALAALDDEKSRRMLERKVATHLAATHDVRVHDRAKFEAERDEARKPFAAETKRAHELAKRFAEYRTLAERIVGLFRSDALVARFGSNAYSRVPVRGSHVSFVRTFRLPRVLATPERLTATRLLGFWPPKWNNFEGLEAPYRHDEEPDFIAGPVYELCQKSIISDGDIDRVVGRATALLVSEYSKVCAAIRELLALDDQITAADRAARYPDGGMIFDSALFPEHWHLGLMSKSINGYARIALPVIDGVAMAAE
jgi:hypothetical protein